MTDQVIQQLPRLLGSEQGIVGHAVADRHREMILQVLAHLGYVLHHVDTVLAEFPPITDAGQHEQLRAVDRAAAQYHLAAGGHDAALHRAG